MTNEAFSRLMLQYERLVYSVCLQFTRDAATAEDLTQDVFLSAYLHRERIPAGYERQWLTRIAVNKAKDHLQSAYQRHTVLPGDDSLPPGRSAGAEEIALQRSAAADIAVLIQEMRQPYQPVCQLCLLEEKTPEEAAVQLERPLKTIHTQLARGKRMLREALERRSSYDEEPISSGRTPDR